MVLGMPTRSKRREALETLPSDRYNLFKEMITRIRERPNAAQAELGMRVLMWLHFTCRPLTLSELQHALAVEKSHNEFDDDNIPTQEMILDCCLGLVVVDEETSTVRLVHYTLEQYFRRDPQAEFPNGCNYIAETCLTYLTFGKLRHHCTTLNSLEDKLGEYLFLKYAARYWGTHLKQECSTDLAILAKMIVDHENERPPCAVQALYWTIYGKGEDLLAKKFSGIHVTAYFGLDEYMVDLCKVKENIELKDESNRTPLSWAVEHGHEAVVRLLIGRDDVNINAKDKDGWTPLSWAALGGHEAIVRLLIERGDVDINPRTTNGRTPLSLAASNGHEAIVRLLIGRDDVNINTKDKDGWTPLLWAAEGGHEAIVRLLIERGDVDVESR